MVDGKLPCVTNLSRLPTYILDLKTLKSPSAAMYRQVQEVSRRFAASFPGKKAMMEAWHSGGV
jgi:hypothetical protein